MSGHKRIRVLIETAERSFKGVIHKPVVEGRERLSDHLNSYAKQFVCLSDVEVSDRGQHYRVGEEMPFVAVATSAITFIAPLEDDKG